eukprot:436120_1
MAIYSVKITERQLGVAFVCVSDEHKDENIVSHVIQNSIGSKLGINEGDTLIYINNQPIHKIMKSKQFSSKNIQYTFYHQPLPFIATLKKSNLKNKPILNLDVIYRKHTDDTDIETTTDDEYTPSLDVYSPAIAINSPYEYTVNEQPVQPSITEEQEQDIKSDHENIDVQTVSELIEKHIFQTVENDKDTYKLFDSIVYLNDKICLVCSNALNEGYYEWIIKIIKPDIYIQEIGVVSVNAFEIKNINVKLNKNRIITTKEFGAKAIYGNEICNKCAYYGSYNKDGKERCYRDLNNNKQHIMWESGDMIKVCLDFNNNKVTFFLNDVNVRKAMSFETKNNKYYPIIAFSGNSMYELISFQNKKWI